MTDQLRQAAMQQALEALSAELWTMLDKPVDEQYRVRYAYLLTVITALRTALAAQPQQEHVAWRFKDPKDGHWLYTTHLVDLSKKYWRLKNELFEPLYTAPPQQQAEPMAWDKPSDNFNAWWDGDRRRDNANPFTTDSFAYWAFEGWQAAQHPWVGLTEEEIAVIGDKVANEDLVGLVSNFRVRLARAIEQTLKEKNHG